MDIDLTDEQIASLSPANRDNYLKLFPEDRQVLRELWDSDFAVPPIKESYKSPGNETYYLLEDKTLYGPEDYHEDVAESTQLWKRKSFDADDIICSDCNKEAGKKLVDFGIGPHEYQGYKRTHSDLRVVSDCCAAPLEDKYGNEKEYSANEFLIDQKERFLDI